MANIVGSAIGLLIILAWLIFHIRAFPHFVREISFYRRFGWDFEKEIGAKVLGQDQMIARFSYLPLGIVKLSVLVIQMIFFAMPFIAGFNGYITRSNLLNQ